MEGITLNLSLTTQYKSDTDWSCPVATITKHDGSVHYSMSPMLNPVYTQHTPWPMFKTAMTFTNIVITVSYTYFWGIFSNIFNF